MSCSAFVFSGVIFLNLVKIMIMVDLPLGKEWQNSIFFIYHVTLGIRQYNFSSVKYS